MTKSTWECPVVDLTKKEKHPTGDNLSILRLYDGAYTVVFNTEQWAGKTRAAFIPGQNYVDTTRTEFAWMAKAGEKYALVKPNKLRGIKSDGILALVPEDAVIGENWMEKLGVIHKQDEPESPTADRAASPSGYNLSKYDIDGAKHYIKEFTPNEEVVVTLKYHGQNAKYLFKDEVMYCGGRTQWLKDGKADVWKSYHNYPQIGEFCRANPNLVLWGECLMQGQYTYGNPPGYRGFVAFDIRRLDGSYFDYDDFLSACSKYNLPVVRELYRGPYSHEKVVELAETLPKEFDYAHEGVVVKPVKDRQTSKFERLIYKVISSQFKD